MAASTKSAPTHDPGGKVRRALKDGVIGSAKFGGVDQRYRYRLERTWDATKPRALFVLMNPSTADPSFDDPTVAKCCKFARGWGYGGIFVGNTFAYRATNQKQLIQVADPIGPDNDKHLIAMAKAAAVVIFAYGKPHRTLQARGLVLARLLKTKAHITPYVLRLTKDGTPFHPLYLPQELKPVLWAM